MTNNLIRRIAEHKQGQIDGYSRERGTDMPVWFEHHRYVDPAILREKRIKRWPRPWKFALIEEAKPRWADQYGEMIRTHLQGVDLPGPHPAAGLELAGGFVPPI